MTTDYDILTTAYNLSRNTRDAERWGADEWIKLARAYKACGWDVTPDNWTAPQVWLALRFGIAPDWDENERPKHPWTIDESTCKITGRVDLLQKYLRSRRFNGEREGWGVFNDREIQRADMSAEYETDEDAAHAARQYLGEIR